MDDRTMTSNPRPGGHLQLSRVTKRFGTATAVDNVSFEIPQGAFATLLGPSGCGKTTLLRIIAGFYEPEGGTIALGGKRIDELPAHQRGTAMVFQDYALFPHMTVGGNVGYGLRLAHVPKAEEERRVGAMLEFVGLGGLRDRRPDQLSGGQQQRVALARALIIEPTVLLLDEPLSNLDATLRERMRWELRALQKRLNITFLYVTHDQAEALAMSDWIAVMNSGHVEQWGVPKDIYRQPRSAFTATFIGSANLRPATVLARDGQTLEVRLYDHQLTVPAPDTAIGDKVLLCIRPETLTLERAAPEALCLTGILDRSAFLGNVVRHWIRIEGDEWMVDQPQTWIDDLRIEGEISVYLYPGRIHVIGSPSVT